MNNIERLNKQQGLASFNRSMKVLGEALDAITHDVMSGEISEVDLSPIAAYADMLRRMADEVDAMHQKMERQREDYLRGE